MERLTCRTGPNDEQARLIAQDDPGPADGIRLLQQAGNQGLFYPLRGAATHTPSGRTAPAKSTVKLIEGTASLEYKPGYLKIKVRRRRPHDLTAACTAS
jgi:hypothetical protein